jgi:hypothetical protein
MYYMSSKCNEIEIARRFLIERGAAVIEVLTLKDFARRDPDPDVNIEHLDSVCPDIVAITDAEVVGLELTAYSVNQSHNALEGSLSDLRDATDELRMRFPELRGFQVHISPNTEVVLRKRDVPLLATELLEFVRSKHTASPFNNDEDRHYSLCGARANETPFAGWHLLDQHAQSVTASFRTAFQDVPAMLSGGFATHFGTRLEPLTQILVKKAEQLKKAYNRGLNSMWLLIHATGDPRTSRIAPMWQSEAERLLSSTARQTAIDTGFDHVFVWDGLRGGLVDLVRGESACVQQI